MKFKISLIFLALIFIFTPFILLAQESITITTYYPSPYGSYRELRADQMSIGSSYRSATLSDGNLLVFGRVGIGTASPSSSAQLDVRSSLSQGIYSQGSNYGVYGVGNSYGLYGNGGSTGVLGSTTSGTGVSGSSTSGYGVSGTSSSGIGVLGSGGNFGVQAIGGMYSDGGYYGLAARGTMFGVYATGTNDVGVWGVGKYYGVFGVANYCGVYGDGSNQDFIGAGGETARAGKWNDVSDRNAKENFVKIKPQEILDKIEQLPISQWNYKQDKAKAKHLGPVGQDFYPIFGLGIDEKSLSAGDSAAIALVGVKALNKKIKAQEEEIKGLREEIKQLKKALLEK